MPKESKQKQKTLSRDEDESIPKMNQKAQQKKQKSKSRSISSVIAEMELSPSILDKVSTSKCEICGIMYFSGYGLNRHIAKTGHNIQTKEAIQCNIAGCNKTYIYTSSLRRHLREDHGVKKPVIRKSELLFVKEEMKTYTADKVQEESIYSATFEPSIGCTK